MKVTADRIKTYLEIFAILAGGFWIAYTFIYKDIYIPSKAPAFISQEVDIIPFPDKNVGKDFYTFKAVFKIRNNSKRRTVLLPSMFIVTGVKVDRKDISNEDFIKEINEFLNDYEDHQDNNASKYFAGSEYTIISSGEIFYDWYLDPNETARRSAIFFVPKNKYDLIEISTFIPVVNRNGVAVGKWRIDSKGEEIFFDLYKRVVRNGKEEFVDADDDFEFQEEIDFSIIDGYESYPVGRNNQNQSNKTGYDNSVTAPPSLRAYPSRSLKWIIKKN